MFFMILPVGVDYRTDRLPVVTFSLMGLCVLIHLWSMILWRMGIQSYGWWMETFWFNPAEASVWTVFTSLFVHADIFHLLGNMIYLFLFGATTEDILGRGKFALLYLVGGAAAVFGHVALTPGHFESDLPLGGASGAISTCIGAFMLLRPRTMVEFRWFAWLFFRPFNGDFSLSAWIVASFWFLKDLFWAVLEKTGVLPEEGTAFGAHLGGFLLGMAGVGLVRLLPALTRASSGVGESQPASIEPPTPEATPERPFLVTQNGAQYGPYTADEIGQYLTEGAIIPDAFFWRAGMTEWRPVAEYPQPLSAGRAGG
jgi:membrane associated rhomboid family serine protease